VRIPIPGGGSRRIPDPLENEVAGEKAAALGHSGHRMERALAALRENDDPPQSEERERLLDEAAERVWAYLVQRELCGLRDHRSAVADYAIPPEVMNRVGAVRKRPEGSR
jgi:hypothetical protein